VKEEVEMGLLLLLEEKKRVRRMKRRKNIKRVIMKISLL
jgi:hypothetical protein